MLENEIYTFLEKNGINTPKYKVFKLCEKMEADFYPVAVKILSANVVHKTEVGGVVTNVQDDSGLQKAKEVILASLKKHGIDTCENDKLLVSHMCQGIELFFGIVNDPVFEKVIAFGAGGIFTELFKDICFIDSKAPEQEIINAIRQTKIGILFTEGFRGKKFSLQVIVDFIKKLQQLDVGEMDLNPVILSDDSVTVVDARLRFGNEKKGAKMIKHQPGLFFPKKIAIIGVSQHPEKIGYALAQNSSSHPDVYFVNPHLDRLCGKKVCNCIDGLPEIDTAVLAISASEISETIQKLVGKRVKNIIIITAGFKEAGRAESYLADLAKTHDLNIIGPNCLGVYVNGINLTFGTNDIQTGPVNLFSQSGAVIAELMDKAAVRNIGFENIISTGNMTDVDFADLINSYTGDNPVNLYVEGIANGKNLLRAIRKSRAKIRVFKAGRTEVAGKAAYSHTGNMAGNYEMFVSLLQSAGVQILRDINGLIYPYQFERILIVTNAGGVGTVMTDLISNKLYQLNGAEIEELNTVLPPHWSKNNPVDIIGDAGKTRYLKALQIVDRFGADAIFVLVTPQFMTHPEEIVTIFTENSFNTKMFPVLLGGEMMEPARMHLQKNKIVFFQELSEAVSFL